MTSRIWQKKKYFMNLFPNLHLLATRDEKSVIFTIFGAIPDSKRKKNYVSHRDLLGWWPIFFIFSHAKLQNDKKLIKIDKMYCEHCHALCVHGKCPLAQTILISFRDQTWQMLLFWWRLDSIWPRYGYMKKCNKRTDKQTHNCPIFISMVWIIIYGPCDFCPVWSIRFWYI